MSLQFSDTVHKNGVIQRIEQKCGFNDGDISGNATLLARFTGGVNLAADEILGFMFPLGGKWQLDDANHTKYPFISTNLVSGQRDYSFTVDEQGNYILDIYRVMVASPSGVFAEIYPVDMETGNSNNQNTDSMIDGQNTAGVPTRYDKTGNGIFLDLIPNYNFTNGLKIFINREANYFATTDTTKRLGFAHLFHDYLAIKPAYDFACDNNMTGLIPNLEKQFLRMQQAIKDYYGSRENDARSGMRANVENCK